MGTDNSIFGLPLLIICMVFILGIIIIVILRKSGEAKKKEVRRLKKEAERARKEVETNYRDALSQLKSDPTNSDLRQRALNFGRIYSSSTRDCKGVTIFDEIALMNDINAATGGTTNEAKGEIEQRLSKLLKLKEKGLINEHEYNVKRQKILDDV